MDLTCKICDKDCESIRKLSNHLLEHQISPEEYYRKYFMTDGEDKCENCGKPLEFIKLSKPFNKTCSRSCFGKNQLTRERRNKTNIEKFGVDNPFKSEQIKKNIKQIMNDKYGGVGLQSTKIKNKIQTTNINKYGVDNPFKSKSIIQNIKDTNISRINQFEHEYNCTERQKLIDKYGQSWLSIENDLDCIWLDNNHKFIKNYELDKIKEFGPKFCRPLTNELELEILEFIKSIYFDEIRQNDIGILNGHELDIYLSKLNIAVEINGDYYHSDLFKYKKYHLDKSNLCRKHGIRLIHIYEYFWKNNKSFYKDYLINVLKNKNYFEIESTIDNYIFLNYDFGLPIKIDGYELIRICGSTKLDIPKYNIFGCGKVKYVKLL